LSPSAVAAKVQPEVRASAGCHRVDQRSVISVASMTMPGVARRRRLAARAGLGADSEKETVLTAHWLYVGVRQGTREMKRVELAA